MDLNSTIVAISTPQGRGGIGVVRISGSASLSIAQKMLKLRSNLQPRLATFAILVDSNDAPIDEVLITWFQSPRSYTGEDVVEISCHGSPVVLDYCLEQATAFGARLAEPGEFTLRAYCLGRIDLPQAEAVRDLIDSTTLYQAKIAALQKQGALSNRLRPVKDGLVDLIALLEAGIDFAEDDISVARTEEIVRRIELVRAAVDSLAATFAWGKLVREGFSLAIIGPPNAGKSSLFNALLNQDRAIVTPIAGTTRDLVSETMEINGIPLRLIDTAGIRNTEEEIEKIGIEKSYRAMAESTLTLVVYDSSTFALGDTKQIEASLQGRVFLPVWNKCDLPQSSAPAGATRVSALTGAGIDQLREHILHVLSPGVSRYETGFVTSLRHKNLLEEASRMLQKVISAAAAGIPHEMLLLDLYCALEPLDSLTGSTSADDILHRIFSTFCIGK